MSSGNKFVWANSGANFSPDEVSNQVEKLPVGVYGLEFVGMGQSPLLTKYSDKFTFNHELFNFDEEFINIVDKTYRNTVDTLGILLAGTKGTGKTITAKLLANKLELPTLIIRHKHDNLVPFLQNLQQDCIIFIDEYDKIFGSSNELLSVMDGVTKGTHRKSFILTTNTWSISEYLLLRPSRIRYIKNYTNLKLDQIAYIVDKLLLDKSKRDEVVKVISSLDLITVDIVKTFIQEINIHGDVEISAFLEYLNIVGQRENYTYNVSLTDLATNKTTFLPNVSMPSIYSIGTNGQLPINGHNIRVVSPVDKDKYLIRVGYVLAADEDGDSCWDINNYDVVKAKEKLAKALKENRAQDFYISPENPDLIYARTSVNYAEDNVADGATLVKDYIAEFQRHYSNGFVF